MVTALATGLGALPFVFVRHPGARWLGYGNALAAGLMLAASASLLLEGSRTGIWRTLAGVGIGVICIRLFSRLVERHGLPTIGDFSLADTRRMLLIVAVMTLHSFAEGIGVGVSFGGSEALGSFISAAIALHNIPEGLAISLVLVPRGVSVMKAAGWSIFSSLPQPLMALPAFVFVSFFSAVLPVGLGLAAGAMVWMSLAEMIPDARRELPGGNIAVTMLLAIGGMVAFQELVLR